MKRAIFFGISDSAWARKALAWIKRRVITGFISFVFVAIGIVTPLRALYPSVVIADDRSPYRTAEVILTAYSSSPDETDDTPYITAFGTEVRDGVIANNCLPYGMKVQIPELFGDKVFVVEDRKHSRYSCSWVDVWYPSKEEAKKFGIARQVEMLIFE